MTRRGLLAGLVALALPSAGCLATKPHVRVAVQKSEARTQQQFQAVEGRLDTMERELGEQRVRLGTLDGDMHQVRMVVEETAKQADQTRELVARAEAAARDTTRAPTPTPPIGSKPVATSPETLVVHFGFADWSLDNPARLTLQRALKRLRENPALIVRIEGHADNVGSPSQNLQVSQRRADEVWRFLVGNGITRNRIEAQAIGETRPIASNRSPTGRDQNRRVAITLLAPAQ